MKNFNLRLILLLTSASLSVAEATVCENYYKKKFSEIVPTDVVSIYKAIRADKSLLRLDLVEGEYSSNYVVSNETKTCTVLFNDTSLVDSDSKLLRAKVKASEYASLLIAQKLFELEEQSKNSEVPLQSLKATEAAKIRASTKKLSNDQQIIYEWLTKK